MALQQPAIDTHPQREKIIEALLNEESPQSISKWVNPPLSHVAIWRYRSNKIIPKLSEVQRTAKAMQENILQAASKGIAVNPELFKAVTSAAVDADPLLQRINRKYERYENLASSAAEVLDYQGFAAVDRAETQTMRLHAELTGRLQQAQSTTLVQIVVGSESRENTVERADDAQGVTLDIAPVRE